MMVQSLYTESLKSTQLYNLYIIQALYEIHKGKVCFPKGLSPF